MKKWAGKLAGNYRTCTAVSWVRFPPGPLLLLWLVFGLSCVPRNLRNADAEWPTIRVVNSDNTSVTVYIDYFEHKKVLGRVESDSFSCFVLPYVGAMYEVKAATSIGGFSTGVFEPTLNHWEWLIGGRLEKREKSCLKQPNNFAF